MPNFTADQLISLVKTKGLVPTSQQTFQPQSFLDLMNDEMSIGVLPFIMKVRSEYLVYPYTTPIVTGQSLYPIPTRAVGGKVREVSLLDSSGNVYDVPQISEQDLQFYNNSMIDSGTYQFYFQANNVVLVPTPQNNIGRLKITYYQRPNQLVLSTAAAQITSINTGTRTITVGVVPSTFSTTTPLDLVNGNPGFDWRAIDQSPTSLTTTTITFTSLPSTLAVGDWVSLAGTSPVPNIPYELFPMLVQRTVVKLLEALGDQQGLQLAQSKLTEINESCMTLITNRSDANPRKLINRYSPLKVISANSLYKY